jgi:hypothetical protein
MATMRTENLIVMCFMRYYLFFRGQMEYAILSFSVGDKLLPWLFHLFELLFILLSKSRMKDKLAKKDIIE